MDRKYKVAAVGVFYALTVAVLIAMIILGFNLLKNRWHKLDFTVDRISVTENTEYADSAKYHVVVTGSAKTWFYDFNEYQFVLVDGSSGVYIPKNFNGSEKITADRHGSNGFTVSFDTDNLDDIKNYTFKGSRIYISGSSKEGTDIRLFMSEHLDSLVME
ncbi:MAG: hypothetical protein E7514_05705 [Ruminococcaceae bacterium]|nr:hypothetical protein [Oscillospiraceae bacterium]